MPVACVCGAAAARRAPSPRPRPRPRLQIESLHGGYDLSLPVSRAKFEELNSDLFKRTLAPVTQVLKDAAMAKASVHQVSGSEWRVARAACFFTHASF